MNICIRYVRPHSISRGIKKQWIRCGNFHVIINIGSRDITCLIEERRRFVFLCLTDIAERSQFKVAPGAVGVAVLGL